MMNIQMSDDTEDNELGQKTTMDFNKGTDTDTNQMAVLFYILPSIFILINHNWDINLEIWNDTKHTSHVSQFRLR